ncbi:MAG: hypothetical protein ACFFAO_20145 [Candidatus Hermodarchaeota archaeon]
MTEIEVQCPICSEKGLISFSEEILQNVKRGLLAINVPSGTICSHSFITYVDRNIKIRDYFTADYQIQIPKIKSIEEEKRKVPERYLNNLHLIKLNVPAILITYILKSIFFKKKVLVISDDLFLNEITLNFFKYITQETFDISIDFTSKEEYKQKTKDFRNYIVLEENEILKNPDKSLNPKKINVEKQIVLRFFSERDLNTSLQLIKNDIVKAFHLSKSMVDIINESNQVKKVNTIEISKKVEEINDIKISSAYLEFLLNIIRNYFDFDIPSVSQSFLKSI